MKLKSFLAKVILVYVVIFGPGGARPVSPQETQDRDTKKEPDGWETNEKSPTEEVEAPHFSLRGGFALGSEWLSGNLNSSKFNEYREVPRGGYLGTFDLVGESGDFKRFVRFKAKDLLQEDELLQLGLGSYGKHEFQLKVDHIPHHLSNTGRMIFTQSGAAGFALPDSVQSDLKTISTTDTNPLVSGTQIDTAAFGAIINGLLSPVDLQVMRRTTNLTYSGNFASKLNFSASYNDQNQQGARPFGAPFFFTNSNELPAPVDYHTRELKATVEYVAKHGAASIELRDSAFTNRIKALTWDNPLQPTNSTTSPASGQASLAPDNDSRDISLSGVWNLWGGATLSGSLSRGTWKQNDAFLPYTVNTALTPPALPATSPNAKIDTSLTDLSLNVAARSDLSVRAHYRRYRNDNETPQLTFPGYVRTDTTALTTPIENEPVGYTQTNQGLEVVFNPSSPLTLELTAEQEVWDRTHREVDQTNEGRFGLSTDYHLSSWLLARASVRRSSRRIHGNYVNRAGVFPDLREYDEADRDRSETSFILQATPSGGKWDSTLTLTRARDHYPNSDYGLLDDRNNNFSVDIGYSLSDRTSLFAGFAHERITSRMDSRYRPTTGAPPATTTVDDPLNNWTSDARDRAKTYWFGITRVLVPNKWDLDVILSASSSVGTTPSSGVPGGAAEGEPPPLPDTHYTWFNPGVTLRYHVGPDLAVALGYRLERYRETDFAQDNMEPYMPTSDATTSTWLGARQPSYTAHFLTIEVQHSF